MNTALFLLVFYLLICVYIRHIGFEIIVSREECRKGHKRNKYVGKNVVVREEGDKRLDNDNHGTCHLRHGLELAKHTCRNYDTTLACYDEP